MAVTNSTVTNGKIVVTGDNDDTRGISYTKQMITLHVQSYTQHEVMNKHFHETPLRELQYSNTLQN